MTSTPVKLRFRDYAPPGAAYHLGLRAPRRRFRGTLHTHDFAELMWVERGVLVHLINGDRRPLEAGDAVFVRPADIHTVVGKEFAQVAVAFERQTLDFLKQRYFDGTDWPWRAGTAPATYRLDRRQLAHLTELVRLLAMANPTRLALERFLLDILHELTQQAAPPGVPHWLQDALTRLADDREALARGVPALASFAGRTREHVNRVARSTTGLRATDLVNEARLTRAAAQLTLTGEPIVAIAHDCGLPNLSHFYRLFNARFGVTPHRWRLRQRALL
jgi:AraC family transcriptional regulator, dual regulator of chb operon